MPGYLSTVAPSDRKRLTVEGKSFEDSNPVSHTCNDIFQMELVKDGALWPHVPGGTRHLYWDEFKKFYWWEVIEEPIVKKCWKKTMSKSYNGLTYKWRRKVQRPDTCSEETWNAWKEMWNSSEFLKKGLHQHNE